MGDTGYGAMWKRYKGRVLIACSAQAFAQLVRMLFFISAHIFTFSRGTGKFSSFKHLAVHRFLANFSLFG